MYHHFLFISFFLFCFFITIYNFFLSLNGGLQVRVVDVQYDFPAYNPPRYLHSDNYFFFFQDSKLTFKSKERIFLLSSKAWRN